MSYTNTHIALKNKVDQVGNYEWNQSDSTFEIKESKVTADNLPEGHVLVKVLYISNDPTQVVWIQKSTDPKRAYIPPVQEGETMRTFGLGEVVASKSEKYAAGDKVTGVLEWANYAVVHEARLFTKIDEKAGLPLEYYLSIVGVTAMTAYFGLKDIGEFKKDQTVIVSAASGATGSMAVQIAKHILGASKVIGISSSVEKGKWVESIGADVCLNYKDAGFSEQLEKVVGDDFVDAYFDNVGGNILNSILPKIKKGGHVIACGAISGYHDRTQFVISNWGEIITNRLTVRGFIVSDFAARFGEGAQAIVGALQAGKLDTSGSINLVDLSKDANPFEKVPATWNTLYTSKANGKLITKIA